ncbi:oxygen-independent coproporphyrinogen III oxidase [Rhizobium sp. KVB221]|uniref:Coproporphyrinogen-III oxidase n=1 Tax=Rhizobium setariae TaxID=2801340 RepID=A0A936YN91_9HYPH|nr:oxygen-independent coproporphyrinogen III oxidase [Rhizobium setariae]MBL0373570.1 oxygen-independent coproporphyrinogen III oxidase [Rhizobium setariae]
MSNDFVTKYGDARLPRYTSYPTAPKFSDTIGSTEYVDWIKGIGAGATSLYLHIPFCRSMCWYCGCHTTITERDQPILDYLDVLHREIELVSQATSSPLDVKEIHFGGGTPTIIKPHEFAALMQRLRGRFAVRPDSNVSVEIDPRTLTADMASALGESGVTRASLGVQSFDPVVQKAINRIQSEETTDLTVRLLRDSGIARINFDLIYGLPHQTVDSCVETVRASLVMRPDRFAVFGYAHIPTFKKHQRLIDENALPGAEARNEQAEAIAEALIAAGYRRIGLDHFALPDDELARASDTGKLRRNFQGYTTDDCENLLGFGASAIGRLHDGYVQNEVPPGLYAKRVASGSLATAKGYRLTAEDRLRAHVIERLMCDFAVDVPAISVFHGFQPDFLLQGNARLFAMVEDGVITEKDGVISMDEANRFMIRAVASAFDAYLADTQRTFSKAA